ncbi:MAG: GntR family transcriptional regulator [Candidatus Melainabacteria bacterium]|nr:GntR family transcriptional regulator [Candidatus Melainabacteria bacterium]
MLELSIQRGGPISIHHQLVTQISLQIASGRLPEGKRLPSIRAMASRLNVHYNTCLAVYKELEASGLVEIRQGSGVIVLNKAQIANALLSSLDTKLTSTGLNRLTQQFLTHAYRMGYTWPDILETLEQNRLHLQHEGPSTLYWVSANSDWSPLYIAELERLLKQPVLALNPTEERLTQCPANSRFLTEQHQVSLLQDLLGADPRITGVESSWCPNDLDTLRKLPSGTFVLVLSTSSLFLQSVSALLKALRGSELAVTALRYRPEASVSHQISSARILLTDCLVGDLLIGLTDKPLRVLSLLPVQEQARLKALLLPETTAQALANPTETDTAEDLAWNGQQAHEEQPTDRRPTVGV